MHSNGSLPPKVVRASDRTNLIPRHQGSTVLPNFGLFTKLLRFANQSARIVVNDVYAQVSATHIQLLTDVLHVRNTLQASLNETSIRQLEQGVEVFITLLSPGGYEYVVAFLAIVALGAVVVPLCKLENLFFLLLQLTFTQPQISQYMRPYTMFKKWMRSLFLQPHDASFEGMSWQTLSPSP